MPDAEILRLLDPASSTGCHYADLARNLRLKPEFGEKLKSLVVSGSEPGTGCSSVCLGLGAALAASGYRVAVVDCNLDRPCLHRMLGEPNFKGLTSGSGGERELERYGFEVSPNLLVVPTGPIPPSPEAHLNSQEFVRAVRGLEKSRDFVLLDVPVAPRLLGSGTLSRSFDGVLLVVHAARTTKQTARRITDDLLEADVNLVGVVLNGCV